MAKASAPRLWTPVLIALASLAISGLSLAQETVEKKPDTAEPAQADPSAKPPEEKTLEQPLLEEMVVTAQKRTENAKDVPVSVTSVTDQTLDVITAAGGDVKALSGRVPSLLIESSFGRAFPRFYIRGLGNTDFDLNASQPVSMVYDEVVLENPVVKGMPVWDLDRVEVLRGPQGTLFGRNTPAGIIKFESKKPSQDFEAYAEGSYGTFSTIDVKGAVGGGLTETLSARFSFLHQSQSDWVDNGFTGRKNALGGYQNDAYRLQTLWGPTVRFSALLNVHGWKDDGTARIFRANMIKHGTDQIVSGFDQREVFQDGKNKQTINANGGVAKLDYRFDTGTLTSVTGYERLHMFSRGDIDGGFGAVFAPPSGPGFIPFPSESSDGIPKLKQLTEELRYASNLTGNFQWLVGAFYFDENFKAETISYSSLAPGNPEEGFAFQRQHAKSYAGFGSVDLVVAGRWKLKGGLRFTHDEKDFSAERPKPLFFNTATIAPLRANTDADFTNWDLSATYAVSSQVNLYSRVGTGSRAPAIQGRILFAPDTQGGTNPATNGLSVADTEDILSGEVGVKSELFNRSLRLNAAVYRYEVDGQQITAVGGQYNVATILNVDKTEGYGFESDIDWAPDVHWLGTFGLSYNHTRIKDPNLTVAPCGGGCSVLDPVVGGLAYVNGNSLPHAPQWIFNGLVNYKLPVGGGEIVSSLDWSYYSQKQFFLYESKEFRGDGFEAGLRLGYAFKRGKENYGVSLYGRNITDQVIVQNGIDFNNLTGMTNDPANFGVDFSAKF
ncbi:MAG TPA: TonB-dependent receptor [Thermoanaerobaculia bacterium]|nr:TonB-dependent receptor [Thermoanaerobaculia bacterium]